MFQLPLSAHVDRIVPKTKFYERAHISTAIRDEFTSIVGRITWQYKLSQSTLNIPASDAVEELQIFEIDLKQKMIPEKALSVIDKAIPYPILFVLKSGENICYVMQHKLDARHRYYKTEWNKLPELTFSGSTLEAIYRRLVTSFIPAESVVAKESESFDDIIERDAKRNRILKEIASLENKIRNERQFSKKVELNDKLFKQKLALDELSCDQVSRFLSGSDK